MSAALFLTSKSVAQLLTYGSSPQQIAVQLDDEGCGFCYYESGRVAACINKVNGYQRRHQFYEDSNARLLLATIDEHAIGSAGRPKGKRLILSKDGGLIMDASDQITKSWRWDPKARKAGTPPTEPVVIQLNDLLHFTYTDRSMITVKFAPGLGISVVFECGERLRRTDTYLDHAQRATSGAQRGKLLIDQDVPTLQQRQKQIERDSIDKRSKQRPQSKDLGHNEIKTIVAKLEKTFDVYDTARVTPAADGNWKECARLQSLQEIPHLPNTGTEIGSEPTLFGAPMQPNDASPTLQRLRNPQNGDWLGSVEVHEKLLEANPSLARKGALSVASGRYTRELPVSGYVNGRKPPTSTKLALVSAANLDRLLVNECSKDELVVVACLRADDQQSCAMEMVLEQVQFQLREMDEEPASSKAARTKCRLVKCNLAESSLLSDRYRIHAAPTFLIFHDARLVHVSSLGGAPLRVFPAIKNPNLSNQTDALPRVLLVEKTVKQQVAIEKVLRKEAFEWDLAISGEQAVSFFTRLPMKRTRTMSSSLAPYGLVLISDVLEDMELRLVDRMVRTKGRSSSGSLVCAIMSAPQSDVPFATSMCLDCRKAQGRRISESAKKKTEAPLACPHCGIIIGDAKTCLVSPVIGEVAHVFVHKHIKPATLHRLAEKWLSRSMSLPGVGATPVTPTASKGSFTGLTVESFFTEVDKLYATAKRGLYLPEHHVPAMALCVADASVTQAHRSEANPTPVNIVTNLVRSSSA